jgi:hypothetical protein
MQLHTQSQACGSLSPEATKFVHFYSDENHRYIKQTQVKRNSHRQVIHAVGTTAATELLAYLRILTSRKFSCETQHVLYASFDMFNGPSGRSGNSHIVNSQFSSITQHGLWQVKLFTNNFCIEPVENCAI